MIRVSYRPATGFVTSVLLFTALLITTLANPAWSAPPVPPAVAAAAAAHESAQPPAPKPGDVGALIATLKNKTARAALIAQLETLSAANRAAAKARSAGFLETLSQRIGAVGDGVSAAIATLDQTPAALAWASTLLTHPDQRRLWGRALLQLAAIALAGWLAEKLVALALRRTMAATRPAADAPAAAKWPLAATRTLFGLVPVLALAGAAYGVTLAFAVAPPLRREILLVIVAWAAVRAILVVADALVSPDAPERRLVPMDDETAEYLVIWTRRLAGTILLGRALVGIMALAHAPRVLVQVIDKGVGLLVALLAAIFILQNRRPVAAALDRIGRRLGSHWSSLADKAASIWHLLAILYIAAIYLVWAIPIAGGAAYMLRATALTLLVLTVAHWGDRLTRRGLARAFAIDREDGVRLPHLEARANRYLPALQILVRTIIAAVAAMAVLRAWGVESFAWIGSDMGQHLLATTVSIGAVVIGAVVVWELVSGAIERFLTGTDHDGQLVERSARARTLLPLARSALLVAMVVMVTLIVLSELGVNIAPLLAGAGVIGIAIGFGSQKLVQDVITGAFMLFENTISVGDVVQVDNHSGVVETISIRVMALRDLSGNLHTIPFSQVHTVINMNRDFAYAVFDMGIAYDEDVDRVMKVMAELGAELQADPVYGAYILEPLEMMGVNSFGNSSVVIRARLKTKPLHQWEVGRAYNRILKKRFDAEGIEIPFPQTTIWMGKTDKAEASALPTS